jgi:hypothetical protein
VGVCQDVSQATGSGDYNVRPLGKDGGLIDHVHP